ncbi:MAG: LytTR family DNA-binding domain-containing protein [Cyclobacteriaceae bacterium]
MRYNCLIIDDEELARGLLEAYLSQLPDFHLVASCASAIRASDVLSSNQVDLIFLDIEMPVLKGTDFFKNLINPPKVIFTTAYRDYALDGFDLNAVDYLLKPIVFERFFKAVQKFKTQQLTEDQEKAQLPEKERKNHVFVGKNMKQVRILLDEILYVESLKDYVKIHLSDEVHLIKRGITVFEKELDDRFVRVHRSYIVNSEKITAYTKNDIEIEEIEIPIGGNYKEGLLLTGLLKD